MDKRKVTETNSIIPKSLFVPLAGPVIMVVSIILAYVFLDQKYIDWHGVNNTDDPTSIYTKTTDFAQAHWILVPSGIAMILISIWKQTPEDKLDLVKWHHRFMAAYFMFTSVAFSGLITLGLKHLIGRVRPDFYNGEDLWRTVPFGGEYQFLSFPSGHMTTAGSLLMLIVLFAPRFSILGVLFAGWIFITRMAVGAHYPSDLIGGLLVGSVFTWLYARSFARKRLLFRFDEQDRLAFRKPYGSR